MAEGGVEDEAKAYETVTEKMCDICLEEDSFKQASWYCKQCSQRLCDKCRKYHSKYSTTKGHAIIQVDEMSPISLSEHTEGQSCDEYRAPLCPTHNQPLESYCKDHKVSVCNSCKRVEHRKCKNLQDLQQVVTEHKWKFQDVVQHLRAIDAGMDEIGEAMEKEADMMEANKTAAIQKIEQEMKRIESLGQQKILEVEEMFKQENKDLERETEVIKQSRALVSKHIDDLEKSSKIGSEEGLFVTTRAAEIQAEMYQDILNESSFLTHREIQFEVNRKLGNIDTFGDINLEKTTASVQHKPQVIDYLNINCKQMITWFDTLPNDQFSMLTFSDDAQEESQLRLYSDSKCLLSQLSMPPCLSAVKINDHQIIVAISSEQQLKVVNTDNNKLEQQSVIKTQGAPWLVSEYSNQSVLIVVKENGKFSVQLLDLGGTILKPSAVLADLQIPTSMRTSPDRQAIYITDKDNGILGFNLQGGKLFHFTQQSYELYWGLSLDNNNSLYFCAKTGARKYALIKISSIGVNVKPIFCNICCCIPLLNAEGKLYLCRKIVKKKHNIAYMYLYF